MHEPTNLRSLSSEANGDQRESTRNIGNGDLSRADGDHTDIATQVALSSPQVSFVPDGDHTDIAAQVARSSPQVSSVTDGDHTVIANQVPRSSPQVLNVTDGDHTVIANQVRSSPQVFVRTGWRPYRNR